MGRMDPQDLHLVTIHQREADLHLDTHLDIQLTIRLRLEAGVEVVMVTINQIKETGLTSIDDETNNDCRQQG